MQKTSVKVVISQTWTNFVINGLKIAPLLDFDRLFAGGTPPTHAELISVAAAVFPPPGENVHSEILGFI